MTEKKQGESLSPIPSHLGTGEVTEDAVWGEVTGEGPNYRNVCISLRDGSMRRLTTGRLAGWELPSS